MGLKIMHIGKVYVAGMLGNNQEIRMIQDMLRANQILITYDWTTHGRVNDRSQLTEIAKKEQQGVSDCDVFFAVLPGGGGTHCELGMAITLNKQIILLETGNVEEKSFYNLPNIHRIQNVGPGYESIYDAVRQTVLLLNRINQNDN